MLVLYANQFVYIVLSIFVKPRRYKVAKTEHTYGYIICGRNEEKVIGNLIDSILKQDYPKEKCTYLYVQIIVLIIPLR